MHYTHLPQNNESGWQWENGKRKVIKIAVLIRREGSFKQCLCGPDTVNKWALTDDGTGSVCSAGPDLCFVLGIASSSSAMFVYVLQCVYILCVCVCVSLCAHVWVLGVYWVRVCMCASCL